MTAVVYLDTTLRDGSHALHHQVPVPFAEDVVRELAASGVPYIEVGHGAGLGGSTVLMGRSLALDEEVIRRCLPVSEGSRLCAGLIPGFGTIDRLKRAVDAGLGAVRVATHCTEADVGLQHIRAAGDLDIKAMGFLMMAHAISPAALAEQAAMMEDAGAEVIYIADSAGYMLEHDVRSRVDALRSRIDCEIGLHMHNNLGLAVSNTLAGIDAGATWADGSLAGLGAGAGNTPGEILALVVERLGYRVGLDGDRLVNVAQELVRPAMIEPQIIDRDSVIAGSVGVYSSLVQKARKLSAQHGLDVRSLLSEAARRHAVAGQEDLLEDIALEIINQPVAGGAHHG
jgi:4-hydroxy-2-oxovalerate/4-hydroxy-2-oxohexanoate aldolase